MTTSIASLRQQLQDLKALHDSGALGEPAYTEARTRLERALVDEVVASPPAAAEAASAAATVAAAVVEPHAPRRLQAGLAAGILALAVLGYAYTGSPGHAGLGAPPQAVAAAPEGGEPPISDEQVKELVDKMAQRLKEKPDDATGWALLARAYSATGRVAEALPAFRKALELAPSDANLMADLADALAVQNNGKLDAQALQLVAKALTLEPGNIKALALSGTAAFDRQDYASAVRQWEQVERALPPESAILAQVRASIAEARQQGGLPPATPAPAPATPPAAAAKVNPSASAVAGVVTLAPALAARAGPDDTVFIVARAAVGPRMPLAVLRKQVRDLPITFSLDDSMAMAPTARISDHPQVIVSARISKSGDAMPQPGDLSGQSAAVAPGTAGLAIVISDAVEK